MKTAKKAILLVLCAIALVVASVLGTLAYLQSETSVITNTMTAGKVQITLDEIKVDQYGDAVTGEGAGRFAAGNTYKLIAGHDYDKDPTIHVDPSSESAYLFVEVVNEIADIEAAGNTTIAAQMATNGWIAITEGSKIYYHEDGYVMGENAKKDFVVFENFTVAGDVDNDDLANYENKVVTVKGYAVQADGFGDAVEAWNATFGAPVNP